MRTITLFGLTAIVLVLFSGSVLAGEKIEKEYMMAVSKYFNVPGDSIAELIELGISAEDIPVTLLLAQRAVTPPIKIGKLRARGDSWMGIMQSRALTVEIFYFMVSGEITSKTFAPIFAKFDELIKNKKTPITLSDEEIVNMVNLRFISSHYDYSVFEIMQMRDFGKDYFKINDQVKLKREEMIKEEKLKEEEAAKAKKTEGN